MFALLEFAHGLGEVARLDDDDRLRRCIGIGEGDTATLRRPDHDLHGSILPGADDSVGARENGSVQIGPGCPKCGVNAAGPSSAREAGVAFMNPGLRTRTSQTEQRLKVLLAERIRLHHGVNAVRIARTFYGRQEVWPDILVPQLRIAVEYDDPGRSRRAHMGLKEASDLEKDDALREVGWEVVRIRAGGLQELGPHSVVCRALTPAAVDEVVACMRRIRGDAAVDALVVRHPAAS